MPVDLAHKDETHCLQHQIKLGMHMYIHVQSPMFVWACRESLGSIMYYHRPQVTSVVWTTQWGIFFPGDCHDNTNNLWQSVVQSAKLLEGVYTCTLEGQREIWLRKANPRIKYLNDVHVHVGAEKVEHFLCDTLSQSPTLRTRIIQTSATSSQSPWMEQDF